MGKDNTVLIRESLLDQHHTVKAIAALLKIDNLDLVVVHLQRFWLFSTKNTEDGLLRRITPAIIDEFVGCAGFAEAYASVGWGEVTEGGYRVNGWDKYLSKKARERMANAERQARFKKRKKEELTKSNGNTVTGNEVSVTSNAKNVTGNGEGVTEQQLDSSKDSPKLNPCGIPPELYTPQFAELWQSWERHRKEKKQPLTNTNRIAQLKKLAQEGLAVALWRVNRSIENGWVGLWFKEDKEDGRPTGTGRPVRNGSRLRTQPGSYADLDTHNLPADLDQGTERTLFDEQEPF